MGFILLPNLSNFTLRCMEHSLHLAVKHFVESTTPLSSETCDAFGDESDDEEDVGSGDSLGMAIALVKQVCFLFLCELIFLYLCWHYRFINLHKQDPFLMWPAAKLGSIHLSSCSGSALIGAHSSTSWSISSFSNQYVIFSFGGYSANPLIGSYSVYPSCRWKWWHTCPLQTLNLCRLPPWLLRLGPPRDHSGCLKSEFGLPFC